MTTTTTTTTVEGSDRRAVAVHNSTDQRFSVTRTSTDVTEAGICDAVVEEGRFGRCRRGQLQACIQPDLSLEDSRACCRQAVERIYLAANGLLDYYRDYSPPIDAVIPRRLRCYALCPMFSQPPTRSV